MRHSQIYLCRASFKIELNPYAACVIYQNFLKLSGFTKQFLLLKNNSRDLHCQARNVARASVSMAMM